MGVELETGSSLYFFVNNTRFNIQTPAEQKRPKSKKIEIKNYSVSDT